MSSSATVDRLRAIPALDLWTPPSPLHELTRLREALGGGPRLFIKRDDAIPFGFGGNKVRKIALVAARQEAILVDQTYTAKALAGLMAHWRRGSFAGAHTVLFWHTGGR
ncbi:MAG: hypothetical protein AABY89_06475 [Acidobacteriota bacterium]